MANFKAICKTNREDWVKQKPTTKIITTSRLFGLIKTTKVVSEHAKSTGPDKEELCIVTDSYTDSGYLFYNLAGYPYGGYDSRHFIRLDEIQETQKEIAEKSQPVLN